MVAQDFSDNPVATAGANDMHTDLGILKDPLPVGTAVDPCPRFITADQTAATQARQDLLQPVVQLGVHPLEEVGQCSFADGDPIHLSEERGQPRVTDRMGVSQVGRQTLDGGPKRRARLHPHRHRGYIRLPTVRSLPGMLLHPGDNGLDRRQLDLVIHRMGMLLVGLYRAPTMWAGFGLGDDDLVRFRMQRPAPTRTSDTGLATCPRAWTWRTVRLRGLRGRHT